MPHISLAQSVLFISSHFKPMNTLYAFITPRSPLNFHQNITILNLIPMIPSDILIEDLLLCPFHMKLSSWGTVQMFQCLIHCIIVQ